MWKHLRKSGEKMGEFDRRVILCMDVKSQRERNRWLLCVIGIENYVSIKSFLCRRKSKMFI